MTVWSVIVAVIVFFFGMLKDWLYIFISAKDNFDVLWILLPVWASWFFAEFFQEKQGTSFGNAVSNGVIPLFVSIDWTRHLVNVLASGVETFGWAMFFKFSLCLIVAVYGFAIILLGIRGNNIVKYIGRIREVTYVFVMFSPIMYGIIPLSGRFFIIILLFFPVFYFLIEWLDKITPAPKAVQLDIEESKGESGSQTPSSGNLGESFPGDDLFGKGKF